MDKRLAKRHKRQVARAKENVKVSEPDLRTPEELQAAREAGRQAGGQRNGAPAISGSVSTRSQAGPVVSHRSKAEG